MLRRESSNNKFTKDTEREVYEETDRQWQYHINMFLKLSLENEEVLLNKRIGLEADTMFPLAHKLQCFAIYCRPTGTQLEILEGWGLIPKNGNTKSFQRRYSLE